MKESLRLGLCEEPWLPCESLGDRVSCGSGDADRSSASAHPEEAPADAAKGISAARPVPVPRREEDSGDASSFAAPRPPPPPDPGPPSLMVAFPPDATRAPRPPGSSLPRSPPNDSPQSPPKPSRLQACLGESQRVPCAPRVLERPARAKFPGRAPFRAPATRVLAGVVPPSRASVCDPPPNPPGRRRGC